MAEKSKVALSAMRQISANPAIRLVDELRQFVFVRPARKIPAATDQTLVFHYYVAGFIVGLVAILIDFTQSPYIFTSASLYSDQVLWLRAAQSKSFIDLMLSPDYIYFSFLPRYISWLAITADLHVNQIGLFYQVAASFFRGWAISLLLSPALRLLGFGISGRIAAAAGLIYIGTDSNKMLFNIGYFEVTFMFLVALLALHFRGRFINHALGWSAIYAGTKIFAVLMLPLFIVAALRQRGWGRFLCVAVCLLFLFDMGCALMVRLEDPNIGATGVRSDATLAQQILTGTILAITYPWDLAMGGDFSAMWLRMGGGLLIAATAVLFADRLGTTRRTVGILVVIYALIMSIGSASVKSVTITPASLNYPRFFLPHALILPFAFGALVLSFFLGRVERRIGTFFGNNAGAQTLVVALLVGVMFKFGTFGYRQAGNKTHIYLESTSTRWNESSDVFASNYGNICMPTPHTLWRAIGTGLCRTLYGTPSYTAKFAGDFTLENKLDLTGKLPKDAVLTGVGYYAATDDQGGELHQLRIVTREASGVETTQTIYREIGPVGRFVYLPIQSKKSVSEIYIQADVGMRLLRKDEGKGEPAMYLFGWTPY